MKLLLDAWLDRANTRLRILDKDSGNEILSWNDQQVRYAIETGLINPVDLAQHQPTDEELLNLVACMGY